MNKTKFKVGDKVYHPPLNTKIFTLEPCEMNGCPLAIDGCVAFTENGVGTPSVSWLPEIFHATDENHTLLGQLYGVEFEAPPKPKTPKEIIQAMLDDGWYYVPVFKCGGIHFIKYLTLELWRDWEWVSVKPFDPKTGKTIIDYIDGEIVTE